VTPHVLVVEDEHAVLDAMTDVLARFGYAVEKATTRSEAAERGADFDLVVLDLGLPDGDGLEICAELAARVPVIVVSARASETHRVVALEVGADDYLAKPFGPRELVARCRAVLRRATKPSRAVVRVDDLEIDIDRLEARRDGVPLQLTTKERELLVAIARRDGALVRREDLAEEVWGASSWSVRRSIDVHVSTLRRKLGDSSRQPRYIVTLHGAGFRLAR
jgi:DNA-binding response OmpR family regulator